MGRQFGQLYLITVAWTIVSWLTSLSGSILFNCFTLSYIAPNTNVLSAAVLDCVTSIRFNKSKASLATFSQVLLSLKTLGCLSGLLTIACPFIGCSLIESLFSQNRVVIIYPIL